MFVLNGSVEDRITGNVHKYDLMKLNGCKAVCCHIATVFKGFYFGNFWWKFDRVYAIILKCGIIIAIFAMLLQRSLKIGGFDREVKTAECCD